MLPARDNRYAAHRVLRVRYRLDEAGWSSLEARLSRQGWRGAIVGPHGSGKTTLAEDLARRLQTAGWRIHGVRLSSERRRVPPGFWTRLLPSLGAGDALFVDGAEQLDVVSWWILTWRSRRVGAVVVTTHRPGRLAPLHWCETTPELLQVIVEQLGARLEDEPARALFVRHRGNLREALRELYDRESGAGVTCGGPAA